MQEVSNSMSKGESWLNRNALTIIIGLIGAILTSYFYFLSQEKPGLSYYVYPDRTSLVKKSEYSRLSVFYDGVKCDNDVSVVKIAIWNAGKKPIRAEDVLTKMRINIGHNAKIMSAKLMKTNRLVTEVSIDTLSMNMGAVFLNWKILERNDAAIIQLIYQGSSSEGIIVSADIVGQKKLLSRASKVKYPTYREYEKRLVVGNVVSRCWAIVLLLLFVYMCNEIRQWIEIKLYHYIVAGVLFLLFVCFVLITFMPVTSNPPIHL